MPPFLFILSFRVEKDWYIGLDGDEVEAFLLEEGDQNDGPAGEGRTGKQEVGSRSPGRRSLTGFSEVGESRRLGIQRVRLNFVTNT